MEDKRYNFKFGISSWSYPWSIGITKGPEPKVKMTALDLLMKAKALDVKLVQIADNLPLENLSEQELDEFTQFASQHNIAVEVGTKGIGVDHLMRFLGIAKKVGSNILRTIPAIFGKTAVMEELEANIRVVLPEFQRQGITIVLENTEAFTAQAYADLMERVNHPNFRMCMDLSNALGKMEGPAYVLEKLVPYCGNYHFKDVEIIRSPTLMGFTVYGKPSGQGHLSLPTVLDTLLKHELNPTVIIELWPPLLDSIEDTTRQEEQWVAESVNYMRSLMG